MEFTANHGGFPGNSKELNLDIMKLCIKSNKSTVMFALSIFFSGTFFGFLWGEQYIWRALDFWISPPSKMSIKRFEARTLDGKQLNSEVLQNKITFLYVWSASCAYCYNQPVQIKELEERFKEYPEFQILGVVLDENPLAAMRFVETFDVNWSSIVDETSTSSTGRISQQLRIDLLPAMYIIDRDGESCIRYDSIEAIEMRLVGEWQ